VCYGLVIEELMIVIVLAIRDWTYAATALLRLTYFWKTGEETQMIKIENVETSGLEAAIRGMRNPKNSWERSDTAFWSYPEDGVKHKIGPNDHKLMMQLVSGGPVHAKFRRFITVSMDITAPLYWWKEFDTYKVGTACNSCSTMHKIHAKEFTLDDFSYDHLLMKTPEEEKGLKLGFCDFESMPELSAVDVNGCRCYFTPKYFLKMTCEVLNHYRKLFLETHDKRYWWQMIQLLPSSYNQRRTVLLNYEVLANIYRWRKDHKLDEWREFCKWIESLPYSEVITGEEN
jgi:hypothetical protein